MFLGLTDLGFFVQKRKMSCYDPEVLFLQLARQTVVHISTEYQYNIFRRGLAYFCPEVFGEPELEFFVSDLPVICSTNHMIS